MDLRKSLDRPVSEYTSTDFVSVAYGISVEEAAGIMQRAGRTEAVVKKGDQVVGIFTERDILYKVVAAGKKPSSVMVQDVMSSPIATIDATARVGDAIAKMSELGVRRLGVTKSGKVVGLVTQKSVVSDRVGTQVVLPELTAPGGLSCPYCGEHVEGPRELSKHIDSAHIGRGLLEGDLTKW
jgi:CBS domain-containing protein